MWLHMCMNLMYVYTKSWSFCLDSIPAVGCDSLVAEAFCDNLPSPACVVVEVITCHHWHVWLLRSLANRHDQMGLIKSG